MALLALLGCDGAASDVDPDTADETDTDGVLETDTDQDTDEDTDLPLDTGPGEVLLVTTEAWVPAGADSEFPGQDAWVVTSTRDESGACPERVDEAAGDCVALVYTRDVNRDRLLLPAYSTWYWLPTADDWAGASGGVPVPSEARRVRLSAWGASGGERVVVQVGLQAIDGFEVRVPVTLTQIPQVVTIDLPEVLPASVVYGFAAGFEDGQAPETGSVTFFLDDITWR